MSNKRQAWRYLTTLGVAYLLVCQLLLVGVSAGIRFSFEAAAHDASLCLDAASGDAGTADDPGHGLSPCCSISCPMAGGTGLPPPAFAGSSPAQSLASTVAFSRSETGGRLPHETAGFHARGPPAAA